MRIWTTILALVARAVPGGILLVSGIQKIRAHDWFRETMIKMDVFPIAWIGPLSGAVPGIEVVLGLALILGVWIRGAALATAGLYLAFAILLAELLRRGTPALCGCFGPDDAFPVTWSHVVLRIALSLAAFVVVVAWNPGPCIDSWLRRRRLA
ncbi:MAG: DoxX family membrane protein [Planctomycetes bacterium]|nr:DoxX family membrane protein [Planctomycetota bacterium]